MVMAQRFLEELRMTSKPSMMLCDNQAVSIVRNLVHQACKIDRHFIEEFDQRIIHIYIPKKLQLTEVLAKTLSRR